MPMVRRDKRVQLKETRGSRLHQAGLLAIQSSSETQSVELGSKGASMRSKLCDGPGGRPGSPWDVSSIHSAAHSPVTMASVHLLAPPIERQAQSQRYGFSGISQQAGLD